MSQTEVEVTAIPDGAFLLDVREDDEWAAGHAPDAVHIPMRRVGVEAAAVLPKDMTSPIAVVCKAGGRSAKVTELLVEHGYNAVNVNGGMLAWERAGLPMVSETAAPPEVI